MESNFTPKDAYLSHFNPRIYLESYYTLAPSPSKEDQILKFILRKLSDIFSPDKIKGDLLIELGSGPTIYQFLSACELFKEIVVTDYADQNLKEINQWLKKEPGAFDWSPVMKYVCELEGDRDKWTDKEEKLREKVKQLLKSDVTQSQPLGSVSLPQADCLLTIYCLETACKDLPTYQQALKNISKLLKPGGTLVLFSVLKGHYYMVENYKFSCLPLTPEEIKGALDKAGFICDKSEVIPRNYDKAHVNHDGIIIWVGKKLK
ncbi:nicotinamide N-methyltransferase-like [Sarcophilus harrisii]|uniref:Nicotinamide N-methyltransferase n=1 Tax=Sarcophilus harrisii TaxID=9305 RepID=A0A7N4PEC0_SARHA|nr:nicotinamide N-methyltransferase-like [Sarcophilus harrisii]